MNFNVILLFEKSEIIHYITVTGEMKHAFWKWLKESTLINEPNNLRTIL